jgi:O-acetyl-ADP-ribose deacetylase
MDMDALTKIDLIQGDITRLQVDSIVNAANRSLLGGGGVDGAIHRAAGPQLLEECKTLGGCETGQAKITGGYRLPARYVIHTVGPIYSGSREDSEQLVSCYRNCLQLAVDNGLESIAFPAISCGVYGYPIEEATGVALRTTCVFLVEHAAPDHVVFVLFSERDLQVYQSELSRLILQEN